MKRVDWHWLSPVSRVPVSLWRRLIFIYTEIMSCILRNSRAVQVEKQDHLLVLEHCWLMRPGPSNQTAGHLEMDASCGADFIRSLPLLQSCSCLTVSLRSVPPGCEDIVVESISLDSVITILKWSSQPYGSKWVHRQALHFLCEEFSHIMTSDVLYELSKEHLLTAIQSDYLQLEALNFSKASEQDILKYVIKWGEHQLMKRMADREPNLLSGTAHSVNKRGVKRRDLDIEELKEILSPLLPYVRIEHILPTNTVVRGAPTHLVRSTAKLFSLTRPGETERGILGATDKVYLQGMKRGLISTPPSDMLPTAEGGKANAWLRQKNAGIYVRPRLFSPYVEEAKSVLDEMMVEQTDLVRLRMVRMSNVPDTLYMVNNAVPQCCHMINHQQITGSQAAPPSVVANEIPEKSALSSELARRPTVPKLSVVREMIRRLQELRHTDQVQRAYALNCGEGATVSYEIQIRVLREFGLPDGAAELLQNPHKFFPEERFGDESPVLAMRQTGRCRVNSTPAVESMFTDIEALASFHPPLPPPPPPYHPPNTPSHIQLKAGWRPRAPSQPPSRSFSYPCNHTLLQRHPSSKHSSPAYPPGAKPLPPDCTNPQGMGRALHPEKQGNMEPVINEFMPDIAMGVSAMSLKERRMPEVAGDGEGREPHPLALTTPPGPHYPPGPCPSGRHGHPSCKKHSAEPKPEARAEFPDLYDFPCRPATPASSHHTPSPLQGSYAGPDLYSHSRPSAGPHPPSYMPDMHPPGRPADGLRLDMLEQPPQRLDLALATQGGPQAGGGSGHIPRGRSRNESDLTCGLGPSRSPSAGLETYEDRPTTRRPTPEGMGGGGGEPPGGLLPHRNSASEEAIASRDRRSPNKPEQRSSDRCACFPHWVHPHTSVDSSCKALSTGPQSEVLLTFLAPLIGLSILFLPSALSAFP
ncbi:hypothetical protein JZ751_002918 [Albula glossodonta]|uniref:BACK domain-containing protein n=1 Tax=Albula glossodonta TaxID=121402 RepID=A0A8T2NCM8_9TELE|nr:hypothetical protein JZ751_002918 [Albula glossodonta]